MVSDDVMNSVEIVAYCESWTFIEKNVFNVMLNQCLPSTKMLKER